MIEAILYTLLAVFVIIVLGLVLPVRISVRAAGGTDDGFQGAGRVMLFGGVFGGGGEYAAGVFRLSVYLFSWRVFGIDPSRFSQQGEKTPDKKKPDDHMARDYGAREKEDAAAEKKTAGRRSFRGRLEQKIRGARNGRLYAKIVLREMKSLVHVDRFAIGVTLGLDDPAATGKIAGILYAVNGLLPAQYAIRPGWDFTRRVFSGDADIAVTFRTHLFWAHLARGFWTYTRYRREGRFSFGKIPGAQEA